MRRRRGSVRQVGMRWLAEMWSGVRADGRPHRMSATFDTRDEAESWVALKSIERDRIHGVTLWTAWNAFEEGREGVLANKTMYNYRRLMERFWKDSLGDVPVEDITPAMVQRELSKMTHENALHAKTVISSVLTYCVSPLGILERNPLRGHRFAIPSDDTDDMPWDDDPFAAIEEIRGIWDAVTAIECMERIRGLELEPVWLSCIGAGLRVEEAFALRGMDLRRVEIEDKDGNTVTVTQCAVHHARTDMDDRKSTKTRGSVRIATYLEPFGERMWELASGVGRDELVCKSAPSRQNKTWRLYFDEPEEMHVRMSEDRVRRGALHGISYVPLSRMRNSHETLMQQAGILDAANANMHGHSLRVAVAHYMKWDGAADTVEATRKLGLVS